MSRKDASPVVRREKPSAVAAAAGAARDEAAPAAGAAAKAEAARIIDGKFLEVFEWQEYRFTITKVLKAQSADSSVR
ncbi:MAG TPA: hypothetical protein VKA70_14100 [Blastocatellia bacterium]|nr:hypothetical protein [Blastocatellia bacterium]